VSWSSCPASAVAPAAELRSAAAAPAAAADPRPAQHRFGPGQVAGGAELLVDLGRPVEQRPGLPGQTAPGQGRPRLLGGERQLERARPVGVGVGRGAQRPGVVVQQAPAAQRRPGQRADAGVLLRELGDASRHLPRPPLVRAGQGHPHQVGADHPVLQHQAKLGAPVPAAGQRRVGLGRAAVGLQDQGPCPQRPL